MDVITMESAAYQDIISRIAKLASYVEEQEIQKQQQLIMHEKLLRSKDVMELLHISRRTLQRLRSEGRIGYRIIRGTCFYTLSEVECLIKGDTYRQK